MPPTVSPQGAVDDTTTNLLEQILRRQTSPQRLVRRAKILLALETDVNECHVIRQMHLNRETVRVWRRRWLALAPKLEQLEADEGSDKALCAMIVEALTDHPRPAPPPLLRRNRLSRLLRLRVKTRQIPGGPSAIGPLGRLPRRSANAALSQPSAPAVSGVF